MSMLDRVTMAESDASELSGSGSDDEHFEDETLSVEDAGTGAALSRQNSAQPGQNILQCFWGLASVSDEERRASAVTLLLHLKAAQDTGKVCVEC
jgi:hypothetical protein